MKMEVFPPGLFVYLPKRGIDRSVYFLVKPRIPMSGRLLFITLSALAGCNQNERGNTTPLRLITPHDGQIVACWFVESDGAGHKGYQAADVESSSSTPQNLPLFTNISDCERL
jgi:hypothetical protein